MDEEILLTGRRRRPLPPRRLRAGELELELDGPDLRRVSYRGIEVLSQLYFAFRDGAWNTLPGVVSDLEIDEGPGPSFRAAFRSRHTFSDLGIDLGVEAVVGGDGDGGLTYVVDVTAYSAIEYARIGLNLLHGVRTYKGRPYRAWLDDEVRTGELPTGIAPQAIVNGRLDGIIGPFHALELAPVDGLTIRIDLEGDEFEMEDQRNFGDSTFKTYSTPLQRPAPFRLEPGDVLRQAATIRVADERPSVPAPVRGPLTISVGPPSGRTMPPFGLGQASDDVPLSDAERARIAALRPDHLRVELVLSGGVDAARDRLVAASAEARALGCDLWVDLSVDVEPDDDLEAIARAATTTDPEPRVVYVATTRAEPPDQGVSAEMLARVRDVVATTSAGTEVGVGSFVSYSDLIRAPFDGTIVERLTFATCPTLHRCDDDTVLENVDLLGDEVVAARRSLGDRSLTVGPITLAARHGPYPDGPQPADGLPARVDARQVSLLAAGLTLGHLAELAPAGVDGLTFFETAGAMGVGERDAGSAHPDRFHSLPGAVFPLWHVLADAAESRGAELLETTLSPAPIFTPPVASVAVRKDGTMTVLVASLRRERQTVRLAGLPGPSAIVRVLDASTAPEAMTSPADFRSHSTERPIRGGSFELTLAAYAMVRIDVSLSP